MAGITTQAVIHIAPNAPVFPVHLRLRMFMTVQAAKQSVVGRIRMTIVASCPLPSVTARVDGEFVIKHCAGPEGRRVTAFAGLRESSRNVIGIGYLLIFCAVT